MPTATDKLSFLDTQGRLWLRWNPIWQIQERRAFGQPIVQQDLLRWVGEGDDQYARRQDRATYVNFMQAHASAVTGQLRLQGAPAPDGPDFSMGQLGKIRPAEQVDEADADYAELLYYAVDGIGGDGSEWPVFFDSVDEMAQHTGHRLLFCDTPPLKPIKRGQVAVMEEPPTRADVLAGRRPYLVHLSPTQMRMHVKIYDRTEFCILRVPQDTGRVVDGKWVEPAQTSGDGAGLGYLLLVRNGCVLLGSEYERGGYWLFDPDKALVRAGPWGARLRGEIPLWYHYGEKSRGTPAAPAESHSATDGLGRVGVSLMDCASARDWDAFDAARSGKWLSPAGTNVMEALKLQWDQRNLHVGIPMSIDDVTGERAPVTITDDSAGAVAPQVFQAIVDAKFAEAREQSFQAITSLPASSGWSKEMGFQEVKAPYLVRRAAVRQQSEQNAIRYLEMRMGVAPSGYCRYKRDYSLEPVEQDIQRIFDALRTNGLRSESLEPELALSLVKHTLGGLPVPRDANNQPTMTADQFEAQVRQELKTSAEDAARNAAQAGQLATTFGGV